MATDNEKLSTAREVVDLVTDVIQDKENQRLFLGSYSDGKPRSFWDAITGEIKSPKQKQKESSKKKKKKKKKKNKFKL